jgi:hypothetical protein
MAADEGKIKPADADLDLRRSRDFHLVKGKQKDEGVKAALAADAFNVLNRVNYTGFVGNLSPPFFGRAATARPRGGCNSPSELSSSGANERCRQPPRGRA